MINIEKNENKLYKYWFVIEHINVMRKKIVGHWRPSDGVILSIMHNANNENLCNVGEKIMNVGLISWM
jgi:hypothetical protein